MNWYNVEERKICWRELWAMHTKNIQLIVGITYDVLPTPQNLSGWVKREAANCVWVLAHQNILGHIYTFFFLLDVYKLANRMLIKCD